MLKRFRVPSYLFLPFLTCLSLATAELLGRETVETPAGRFDAEKIAVTYDGRTPSLVGERTAGREHYWRSTGPGRELVKLASTDGSYAMVLVETLRSAYWRENFFPRLKRVDERP